MSKQRHALAIDDISGFAVKHRDLRTTWNGLRTVNSEFDEKHPQLTPAKPGPDGLPLKDARPNKDDDSGVPSWHWLEGVGTNTFDKDSQIEDAGVYTMTFGATT